MNYESVVALHKSLLSFCSTCNSNLRQIFFLLNWNVTSNEWIYFQSKAGIDLVYPSLICCITDCTNSCAVAKDSQQSLALMKPMEAASLVTMYPVCLSFSNSLHVEQAYCDVHSQTSLACPADLFTRFVNKICI